MQISRKANVITFKAGGKTVSIPADNIMYMESYNHSVTYHLSDRKVTYPISLAAIQGELCAEQRFYRCHKSYIVNMDFVYAISRNGILLENGDQIAIGRSFYNPFQIAFVKYLNR